MDKKSAKTVHLIYSCVVTLLIIALAIMLMVSCWEIYRSGDHPYTRASIGQQLQKLSVLLWATGGAILGGWILNLILPLERGKTTAIRDDYVTMQKLAHKAGISDSSAIRREQTLRTILPIATALVYIGLMIYPTIYLFNRSNFSGVNPTAEIQKAALIVLPPAVIGLVLCFLCSLLMRSSIRRQSDAYKQIIASGLGHAISVSPKAEHKVSLITIRCAVFVIAGVFIVLGIFNGSAEDVLTKAVKICTECIGLG